MEAMVQKFRGIVHFKDGRKIESDWFLTDAYVDMFGEKYKDEPGFVRLEKETSRFKEDIKVRDRGADVHPFNHPNGKYYR
jgi:hypothetical protein